VKVPGLEWEDGQQEVTMKIIRILFIVARNFFFNIFQIVGG
jgi:hypothetical protein